MRSEAPWMVLATFYHRAGVSCISIFGTLRWMGLAVLPLMVGFALDDV